MDRKDLKKQFENTSFDIIKNKKKIKVIKVNDVELMIIKLCNYYIINNKLPSDGIIWLEALKNTNCEQNPEFAQNYIKGFEKCGEFIKDFILK